MMNHKNYMVTGASSGVGRALAIEISKRCGCVVLVARREEKLRETLKQMKNPEKHICIPFDLTCFDEYRSLFAQIKAKGIVLDGLVHCGGIQRDDSSTDWMIWDAEKSANGVIVPVAGYFGTLSGLRAR